MRRILSGVLAVILAALAPAGCATRRHNLIARDAAYLEPGTRLRDVYLQLKDGSMRHLTRVQIMDDTLRGTTDDGEQVSIPASDIERAWRVEVDTHLRGVAVALSVCTVLASVVARLMGPIEF